MAWIVCFLLQFFINAGFQMKSISCFDATKRQSTRIYFPVPIKRAVVSVTFLTEQGQTTLRSPFRGLIPLSVQQIYWSTQETWVPPLCSRQDLLPGCVQSCIGAWRALTWLPYFSSNPCIVSWLHHLTCFRPKKLNFIHSKLTKQMTLSNYETIFEFSCPHIQDNAVNIPIHQFQNYESSFNIFMSLYKQILMTFDLPYMWTLHSVHYFRNTMINFRYSLDH